MQTALPVSFPVNKLHFERVEFPAAAEDDATVYQDGAAVSGENPHWTTFALSVCDLFGVPLVLT